jgi:hypothetical protein
MEVPMKNKTLFDIACEMESMNCDLGAARSVLNEAVDHFERKMEPGSFEANYLIFRQNHILNLFYAAGKMLHDLELEQGKVIGALYEKAREIKEAS